MQVEPYLFFEGRCDEAIDFYRRALGAEVEAVMRYKDAPKGMACPAEVNPQSVMHARLRSLSVTAANDAEAKRLFGGLGEGGTVQMDLSPTFFATSFGMVADRFGVAWMVYAPIPVAKAQRGASVATA